MDRDPVIRATPHPLSDPRRRLFAASVLALASSSGWAALTESPVRPSLDDRQLAWIRSHPLIRYASPFNAPPYVWMAGGRPRGLVPSMLDRVTDATGLEFEFRPGRSVTETFERLSRDELDLVPMVRIGGPRVTGLHYTRPFVTSPMAVYTRPESGLIGTESDLSGRRIGVGQGLASLLKARAIDATLVAHDGPTDAFRSLLDGRVDVVITPLVIARACIQSLGANHLWLQLTLTDPVQFGAACAPSAAMLASILDTVLPERPAHAHAQAPSGETPGESRRSRSDAEYAAAIGAIGLATVMALRQRSNRDRSRFAADSGRTIDG